MEKNGVHKLSRSSSSTSSRSRHRHHKKSRRHRRHSSSRSYSRSRSPSPSRRSHSLSRDRERHRRRRSPTRSRSRSRDRSSRKHKKSKHKHRKRSSSSDSDHSEKYSKSRSARSSIDRDRSSRGSTKDRDRRDKERDKEKVLSPVPEEVKSTKKQEMTESEKVAYSRAVEEIGEDGFVQQTFKSSRGEKAPKKQADSKDGDEFNFGTQAELAAKAGKFIPLSDDSLFSPHLFGDPEEREEKYLRRIFSLRQKALLGEPI
ncbi:serine/Arginine-related protein 53 isoform X2 [Procambarus clarkii]|uniref:serine/Arginine-related protein 53 isoform X2 n=1 Tax=Procambarus clarkii TaxID=6728 RepID=UPI003744A07B